MKTDFERIFSVSAMALLAGCGSNSQGTMPVERPLTEAVYASGYIMPKDGYKVFSMAEGFLVGKHVQEGDSVAPGSLLFSIESGQQAPKSDNAREALAVARRNYGENSPVLRELAAAVDNAKAKMENDSLNHHRYGNLLASRATAQVDYDRARLAYQTSQNDYKAMKDRYDQAKNRLYLELQQAESNYKVLAGNTADFQVKSRLGGMVYETYKEEGEMVRRNEALALIGRKDALFMELIVDEQDIVRIKTGQKVLVKPDAFKNEVYEAVLTKIYPMLDRANQSFRVEAEFTGPSPFSVAGLSCEANIIVRHKEKALTIPAGLLLEGDSVWLLDGGKRVKTKVGTGLRTLDLVEITEGIGPNSLLVE